MNYKICIYIDKIQIYIEVYKMEEKRQEVRSYLENVVNPLLRPMV